MQNGSEEPEMQSLKALEIEGENTASPRSYYPSTASFLLGRLKGVWNHPTLRARIWIGSILVVFSAALLVVCRVTLLVPRAPTYKCIWEQQSSEEGQFLSFHPIDSAMDWPRARFGARVHVRNGGRNLVVADGNALIYMYTSQRAENGTFIWTSNTITIENLEEYEKDIVPPKSHGYLDSISAVAVARDTGRMAFCGDVWLKKNWTGQFDVEGTVVVVFDANQMQVGPAILHASLMGEDADPAANYSFRPQDVALSPDGTTLAILGRYSERKDLHSRWAIRTLRFDSHSNAWVAIPQSKDGFVDSFSSQSLLIGERNYHRPRMALSGDGNRMAISINKNPPAEDEMGFCFAQLYTVQVFELRDYGWWKLSIDIEDQTEEHALYTTAPVAISRDGTRVAYGMPGFHRNGCTHKYKAGDKKAHSLLDNTLTAGLEGKVGVFDIDDGQFGKGTQIGKFLYGDKAMERFGYSLDMSPDGTRIVVGSPIGRGRIHVYDWNATANEWIEVVAAKEGLIDGDFIGGSVSLDWSCSGHIAAGHYYGHQANHVHLFRLSCKGES